MSTSAPTRWERALMFALGLLASGVAVWMLAAPRWLLPAGQHQFALMQMWSKLVLRHGLQPLALAMPMLVGTTALLAAGIALALAIVEPTQAVILRLRRALALGATAAVYFFYVRLQLTGTLPGSALVATDLLGHVCGAWAIAELTTFLATYPHLPAIEQLQAQMRDSLVAPTDANRFLKFRFDALRAMDAWLVGIATRLGFRLEVDFGTERGVERNTRYHETWLRFVAGSRLRVCLIVLGLVIGVCFVLAGDRDAFDMVATMGATLGVFMPMFAAAGLQANYRYGSDEDRRRIGWIYLGPVFGFIVVSSVFWVLMLWFLVRGDVDVAQLFGMPVPGLWIASGLLFVPVLIASFMFGLAFAVFYQGTINPRLVLRRGAVVALSGLVLTTLFVTLEGFISSQIMLRVGMPSGTGAVVAGTLAAVMFAPLHRRVDRGVEHVLDRLMPVLNTARDDVDAAATPTV